MDRDPRENLIDSEDVSTPTSGRSDIDESGAARARVSDEREPGGEDGDADTEGGPDEPQIPPPPD